MAHDQNIREEAHRLRAEERCSLNEIMEVLNLPRTTVYHWVKDIPLNENEYRVRERIRQEKASNAIKSRYEKDRNKAYENGLTRFKSLREISNFTDFISFY